MPCPVRPPPHLIPAHPSRSFLQPMWDKTNTTPWPARSKTDRLNELGAGGPAILVGPYLPTAHANPGAQQPGRVVIPEYSPPLPCASLLLSSSSSRKPTYASLRSASPRKVRDEDEVADHPEAAQYGAAAPRGEPPREAEAEAEAGDAEEGGPRRPPPPQEAPHRLLLFHGGFPENISGRKPKCKSNAGCREGMWREME
ncbi:hypothetical protein ACQJBY_022886 [Aegilops geniculata]